MKFIHAEPVGDTDVVGLSQTGMTMSKVSEDETLNLSLNHQKLMTRLETEPIWR